MTDDEIVQQFANFLSWGEGPLPSRRDPSLGDTWPRRVPPAWWAYAFSASRHCPPRGEL